MLEIEEQLDLSFKNSFRLKSACHYFVTLKSRKDLSELFFQSSLAENKNFFILGGGSNVILPEMFKGLVIHPDFAEVKLEELSNDVVRISAGSGLDWQSLIDFALDNKCYGLENLSLIPGKVGAAPIQNIGAYGVEVAQFIESVDAFDIEQREFKNIPAELCQFEYRSSIFKKFPQRYLIVSVNFLLSRTEKPNYSYKTVQDYLEKHHMDFSLLGARDLSEIIKSIRRERLPDPESHPNVGSFFKNPVISEAHFQQLKNLMDVDDELKDLFPSMPAFKQKDGNIKLSAAWLLEQCSLKGYRYKNLSISNRHALVMENSGVSTQKDVLEFADLIKQKVKEKFLVELEVEPVVK